MKFIALLIASIALAASAWAAKGDKSGGCGLGWKVNKQMTTTGFTTRGTTNGLTSNTFGMTSGTSGCAKHKLVIREKMRRHYFEDNLEQLEADATVGEGEYLHAVARLFGCSDSVIPTFGKSSQKHFSEVFIFDRDADATEARFRNMIARDAVLSTNCIATL